MLPAEGHWKTCVGWRKEVQMADRVLTDLPVLGTGPLSVRVYTSSFAWTAFST